MSRSGGYRRARASGSSMTKRPNELGEAAILPQSSGSSVAITASGSPVNPVRKPADRAASATRSSANPYG